MAKVRAKSLRPVDSVRSALQREHEKRGSSLKPIEIVKVAISAYLSHTHRAENEPSEPVSPAGPAPALYESPERQALARGNFAAVDSLLFNANYWRCAYEDRIVAACSSPLEAEQCLEAVAVWNKHTLKLNHLSPDEVVATFERFCPPFAANQRRGSHEAARGGKGPLPDFRQAIARLQEEGASAAVIEPLRTQLTAMENEAAVYEALSTEGSLQAFYDILPAWCLQSRIELVSGPWWDDSQVMGALIDALAHCFRELNFAEPICQYFSDSCFEALDAYHRDLSDDLASLDELSVPQLVARVQEAREMHPGFETDGYGNVLPAWLISKEQLIWNILVCAIYGPTSARPLLVDSPELMASEGYVGKTDVITELAQTSFVRYTADRVASQAAHDYASFASLPADLRDSSIAYISSIHGKLETLGYEVLPIGSCYPDRRVTAFTASEVECLAILEHRRWLRERQKAGWRYGAVKDVEARRSPYLVAWEELPDRAKEWNRSAVRSIPALLASVNLAVVK